VFAPGRLTVSGMKQVGIALVVVLGIVACSRIFGSPAKKACDNIRTKCDLDGKEADECTSDFDKLENAIGKEPADKMFSCISSADSCVEIMGCGAGLAQSYGDQMRREMERGMAKMK